MVFLSQTVIFAFQSKNTIGIPLCALQVFSINLEHLPLNLKLRLQIFYGLIQLLDLAYFLVILDLQLIFIQTVSKLFCLLQVSLIIFVNLAFSDLKFILNAFLINLKSLKFDFELFDFLAFLDACLLELFYLLLKLSILFDHLLLKKVNASCFPLFLLKEHLKTFLVLLAL